MRKFNLLILTLLITSNVQLLAQKKPYYTTQEEIIEAAYLALDQEMKDGDIVKWAQKSGIKGSYTLDITIRNKGEVATVLAVEREGEVNHQNALKNYMKEVKFPFKMPKNKSYKFRYEFKF